MTLTPALESKIQNLIESLGYELYDIVCLKENDDWILRVSLTLKPNPSNPKPSITLQQCQETSLALSPLLDVELQDSPHYFLEVSSPGIERILKTPKHFEGALGELLKIKTQDKKDFKGKLKSFRENKIFLEDGTEIAFENIKKAQTLFEW
ncbi:MAG: ribosome maturation factor RimP, partial [Helicobacter sp.]|nr:ribosome maturation factor RimP [Helicobacter sp.]